MNDKCISIKLKGFQSNCPICLEQWSDTLTPWVYTSCGHSLCEKCYLKQKSIKRTCHICREKFEVCCKRKEKKKKSNLIYEQIHNLKFEYLTNDD